jgi:hypothetical protein
MQISSKTRNVKIIQVKIRRKFIDEKDARKATQVAKISRSQDQVKQVMFKDKSPSSESCSEWFTTSDSDQETQKKPR